MRRRLNDLLAVFIVSGGLIWGGETDFDGAGVGFDVDDVSDDDLFFEDCFVDTWI